jgi:integrase
MEQFALGEDVFTATFTFDRPKVNKVQTHRLTSDSLIILRRYLAERRTIDPTDRGPLLCSSRKDGQLIDVGMSERAINKRVGALGRALGIAHLSPHDCRHYWATMAVRAGTDIKSLQDAGGWASPYMPLRYAQSAEIVNQGVKLDP